MARYRKRPVEVEATQWFQNGDHPRDFTRGTRGYFPAQGEVTPAQRRAADEEGDVVRRFRHPDISGSVPCAYCGHVMDKHGWLDTGGDGHGVCPGDWILTGIDGERYPVKPDIFARTYDRVEK